MQAFSRSLLDLYEAAICTNISDYRREMLKIIKQLIDFDGAVLGMGRPRILHSPDLIIEKAHVFKYDIAIFDQFAKVSNNNPMAEIFVRGLAIPMSLDCIGFYKAKRGAAMLNFVQEHDNNHLLLFGTPPGLKCDEEWLVLYRGAGKRFEYTDRVYLLALWPHLMRCIGINCTYYLSSYLLEESNSAAALINRTGKIEAATDSFYEMLMLEWPAWRAPKKTTLPNNLIQTCLAALNYQGANVDFVMARRGDYILCTPRRRSKLAGLTPTENLVLLQFSSGLSHKKIAQISGSSQNTIRSHIAHGYAKLGVHNKAELANLFSIA